MNNLERNNTVQYELFSSKFGSLIIQEPKGWSNDTESFTRDKDNRGITSKVDIDLEFFGNGADYITSIYTTLGIQEKVLLTKYEKDRFSLSEQWEIRYIQELDLGTYKVISRTGNVTVNATEGGLYSDIKNRESDEYDLLENLSADEVDIGALVTNTFQPLGRKIFVESLLEGDPFTDFKIGGRDYNRYTSESDKNSRPIPLNIVYNSSLKDIIEPLNSKPTNNETETHTQSYNNGDGLGQSDMFFFRAEQDLTLKIDLDLEYKIVNTNSRNSNFNLFSVEIFITEQIGERDFIKDRRVLSSFSPSGQFNIKKELKKTEEIVLNENDSLSMMFTSHTSFDGGVLCPPPVLFCPRRGHMDIYLNVLKSKLIIEDLTAYDEYITISKCIKPLNFFDRLVAKITGKKGLVKSSIFEQRGEYEFMVLDNGFWARGFPDSYPNSSDEEQKIQIKTSFKEAFESFNYLEPLTWFTEFIGNKEYIRIEKATHTQQNFIGVDLGAVDKISYESSKVDYFSNVIIGHDRSLEYEELNGLDEPNGKSEYTTFITKNDSKYSALSKYRTDAVGYELTRRLPFKLYPKEDSKRDEDLWIHDAYALSSGIITHKKWNHTDRFTQLPKGIYDPNSAWNLWLSPLNRLFYGHGYSVKRGLYHYPDKRIKFNSSNANQNLITEKDGVILSESGGISIKDIPTARVEATMISFTFKMNQLIEKQFKGKNTIGGVEIPNYFGLITYTERGVKKYGRLVKLESSDEAKITLIKARL